MSLTGWTEEQPEALAKVASESRRRAEYGQQLQRQIDEHARQKEKERQEEVDREEREKQDHLDMQHESERSIGHLVHEVLHRAEEDQYLATRDRNARHRTPPPLNPDKDDLDTALSDLRAADLASHATVSHPDAAAPLVPLLRERNEHSHLHGGGNLLEDEQDTAEEARQKVSDLMLRQNLAEQIRAHAAQKAREKAEERREKAEEDRRVAAERADLQIRYAAERALEQGVAPPPPMNPFPAPDPHSATHVRTRAEVMRDRQPDRRVTREQQLEAVIEATIPAGTTHERAEQITTHTASTASRAASAHSPSRAIGFEQKRSGRNSSDV